MKVFYFLWQCTWGILQTVLGFVLFLTHLRDKHFFYHGVVVTEWQAKSSVSLGGFLFVTHEPYFYEKLKDEYAKDDLSKRLLVHEYGHTVQSAILGPFYLLLMGIPSTLWGFSPSCCKMRKEKEISYFSFFTERWANSLGEKVLRCKSMEQMQIE